MRALVFLLSHEEGVMKRFVWAAFAALVVVSLAVPAFAQEIGAKFATHVQSHAGKAAFICSTESPSDTTTGAALSCSDYVTQWPLLLGADLGRFFKWPLNAR